MVKLIVDSTCDLPDELLREYDMRVLPLHISMGDKEYRDKVDIGTNEIYSAMRSGIMPKTSQVSTEDLYNTFRDCCAKGIHFIYISFSAAMSGTYQAAKIVLQEFKHTYQDVKMEILDSKSGSMATGLIALEAAKMIQAGSPFEKVSEQIKDMTEHIEHVFTIADLKWLVKGGRIDRLQGMLGSLMNVRPILDVKNGSMEVIKKVRGGYNALNTVTDIVAERIRAFPGQIVGITHTDDPEGAERLQAILTEKTGATNFIVNKIGGVLGSHLGIGGLGVFFLNQKPAFYQE